MESGKGSWLSLGKADMAVTAKKEDVKSLVTADSRGAQGLGQRTHLPMPRSGTCLR